MIFLSQIYIYYIVDCTIYRGHQNVIYLFILLPVESGRTDV